MGTKLVVIFKPGRGSENSANDAFQEILDHQFDKYSQIYNQLSEEDKTRVKAALETDDEIFSDHASGLEYLTEKENETDEWWNERMEALVKLMQEIGPIDFGAGQAIVQANDIPADQQEQPPAE